MKRIMIVHPPYFENYSRDGRCQNPGDAWATSFPPITLASIAGHLRGFGHEAIIFDAMGQNLSWDDFEMKASEFRPDFVVINTATATIENDMRVADIVKKHNPKAKSIAIGGFPSALPQECFKIGKNLDFAVRGERSERPIEHIVEGKPGFTGVVKRSDNDPGKMYIEEDLESLGIPAYELLPGYKFPLTQENWMFCLDSSGCPWECTYCIIPSMSGRRFIWKSIGRVVDEIEYIIKNANAGIILFWSECFTQDKERVYKLCDEIERRGIKTKFMCTTRVDAIDDRLLKRMREVGFEWMSFGLETGSQKILDNIRKGTTTEQARKAVRAANRAGFKTIGHFIIGLPGETSATARETLEFSKSVGVKFAQFYSVTPFPGSVFYEQALAEGWMRSGDWKSVEQGKQVISYPDFSSADIKEWRQRGYREFYFRPGFVWTLFRSVNLSGFLNLAKTGTRFMRWWKR